MIRYNKIRMTNKHAKNKIAIIIENVMCVLVIRCKDSWVLFVSTLAGNDEWHGDLSDKRV